MDLFTYGALVYGLAICLELSTAGVVVPPVAFAALIVLLLHSACVQHRDHTDRRPPSATSEPTPPTDEVNHRRR